MRRGTREKSNPDAERSCEVIQGEDAQLVGHELGEALGVHRKSDQYQHEKRDNGQHITSEQTTQWHTPDAPETCCEPL